MKAVNPYLNFKGNTEEAFNFYKSVFGGEFSAIQRFKETPEAGNTPPADQDKLMHIALPIGKGTILMGTDVIGPMADDFKRGNNFHLSLQTESEDETRKLFKALSAGGVVTVALEKMFWGDYFGMCTDKFGVSWMLAYNENYK